MSDLETSSSSSDESENENVEQPEIIRQVILRPARLNIEMNPVQQIQPIAGYPVGFHTSLLNEIPQYNGSPSELSEYIRATEDILTQFWQQNEPGAYINKLLLSAARNRLKGAALEVVTGQIYNSWDELKETLINNFGDQRSELNIRIDLTRMRQLPKESPIDFYNRIRSLLAILNSKISLGHEEQVIKDYKMLDSKSLALKTYLGGLMEPLGSFLRSKAPQNLETALTYVKDELDIRYFQNINRSQPQQKFSTLSQPIQNRNFQPRQNFNATFQNYQQPPQFRQNFNPTYQLNPNIPPRQFPGTQPKFGKPNQNVFAPKRNFQPQNRPEPMQTSTVRKRPASHQAQRTNPPQRPFYQNLNQNQRTNYIQQSSQPRNFYSEELNHADFTLENEQEVNFDYSENTFTDEYQNESEYFDEYDQNNFSENDFEQTDDVNFPIQASENN